MAASDVNRFSNAMVNSAGCATQIADTANIVKEMVNALEHRAQESCSAFAEMNEEIEDDANVSQMSSVFCNIMGDILKEGDVLIKCCHELLETWQEFKVKVEMYYSPNYMTKKHEREECIKLLFKMKKCAENFKPSCQALVKTFRQAMDVGCELDRRYRATIQDIERKARETEKIGYRKIIGLKIAGFLTYALGPTGYLLWQKAAAERNDAKDKASHLSNLATKCDNLRADLYQSLVDLQSLDNLVLGLIKITEDMSKQMQLALNFFDVQQKLEEENERVTMEKQLKTAQYEAVVSENKQLKEENEQSRKEKQEAIERREIEAKVSRENEAQLKAENESMRMKLEEEAKLEKEARIQREDEARISRENEAQLKAENESMRMKLEEAKLEKEARQQQEDEARIGRENEANRKAELLRRQTEDREWRLKLCIACCLAITVSVLMAYLKIVF